jgi:hypothetical protein
MPRYVMSATDLGGGRPKERVTFDPPTPEQAAAFGDGYQAGYVSVRDEHGVVTLHGRDADGAWRVVAADVDAETAGELGLWFDLTQHGARRGDPDHPLGRAPEPPAAGRTTAEQAVALVVRLITARRLDYPVRGLAADRFAGGWSVYAPVEVDDSDPAAFLDMPVGRSVFLVGDTGRVKEVAGAVPPPQAEALFTAEEAYVRRGPEGELFLAALRDEVERLGGGPGGPAGIASFTVDTPVEAVAARASALLAPIAQQLALLGPPGWDAFTAAFSFTVTGETARLRFRRGGRDVEVPVPEQLALLVRRQRHLAARMPAGPWWRLLLSLGHTGGANAVISTEYDYGDEPLPEEQLLPAACYRADLAAYPRPSTPPWLTAYLAAEAPPARPPAPAPAPASAPAPPRPAPPRREPPPAEASLETRLGGKRLHADTETITYGRATLRLAEVEWVSYSATRIASKRLMFPTFYENTWEFHVGRYPYYGGQKVSVRFSKGGRTAEQPREWSFLVDLATRHLEPRLLADLLTRVGRGETVTVGGSVQLSRAGLACVKPRIALVPWPALHPARLSHGMIAIHRRDREKPLLNVPLAHPNAALLPALFEALL